MTNDNDKSRLARLAYKLEHTKVNVVTVVLFIGFLAIVSALATGVGYVAHQLRHPQQSDGR